MHVWCDCRLLTVHVFIFTSSFVCTHAAYSKTHIKRFSFFLFHYEFSVRLSDGRLCMNNESSFFLWYTWIHFSSCSEEATSKMYISTHSLGNHNRTFDISMVVCVCVCLPFVKFFCDIFKSGRIARHTPPSSFSRADWTFYGCRMLIVECAIQFLIVKACRISIYTPIHLRHAKWKMKSEVPSLNLANIHTALDGSVNLNMSDWDDGANWTKV